MQSGLICRLIYIVKDDIVFPHKIIHKFVSTFIEEVTNTQLILVSKK